jgi:ligand-binding sensor domain-containing protein
LVFYIFIIFRCSSEKRVPYNGFGRKKNSMHIMKRYGTLHLISSGVLWVASSKGLFRYFNETWTNFGDKTGTNIRELRSRATEQRIKYTVGGHGIGVQVHS